MASAIETFNQAVARFLTQIAAFKTLAFGGDTEDVTFEGITRPSLQKRAAQLESATQLIKTATEAVLDATIVVKNDTVAERVLAETAAEAAGVNGKVYADTTAGLAATTNGQYFSVPSAVTTEYLVLYKNNAGVALEIKRYPSSTLVNNMAVGDFSSLGLKMQALPVESGYAWALTDAAQKAALLVGFDGTVTIPKFSRDAFIAQSLSNESGYVWGVLDSAGTIGLGIKADGTVVGKFPAATPPAGVEYLKPSINLWCLGDSLTNGAGGQTTWRQQVAALISARTITNWAVGGQTSTQIAARAAAWLTLLTLTGNQIPASGAVTVSARTVALLTDQSAQSITGRLAGIQGTLTRASDDSYTFTRTTAGTATYCAPKSPFIPDIAGHDFDTLIIFVGRNNLSAPSDVMRDIDAMVGLQKTIEKRFLIITPPNGGSTTPGVSTGEGTGSSTLTNIKTIEDWAVQKYGGRVLKVREFSFQFNDGSADDLDDVAKGAVPRSLRVDSVHWTTAFHTQVANWVAAEINRRGW